MFSLQILHFLLVNLDNTSLGKFISIILYSLIYYACFNSIQVSHIAVKYYLLPTNCSVFAPCNLQKRKKHPLKLLWRRKYRQKRKNTPLKLLLALKNRQKSKNHPIKLLSALKNHQKSKNSHSKLLSRRPEGRKRKQSEIIYLAPKLY